MAKKKDLAALLQEPLTQGGAPTSAPAEFIGAPKEDVGVTFLDEACEIEIGRVVRDEDQPRTEFDPAEIESLAQSIRQQGQLTPVNVRYDEQNDVYVIIAGERRFRAIKSLGLPTIKATRRIRVMDPAEIMEQQLVENLQRRDLSDLDEARGIAEFMKRGKIDSASEAAKRLAITVSRVSRALGLLETAPAVQELVEDGKLSASSALEFAKLNDPGLQVRVAEQAVADGLNRDQVKAAVEAAKVQDTAPASDSTGKRGAKRGGRIKAASPRGRGRGANVKDWAPKLDGFKVQLSVKKGTLNRDVLLSAIDLLRQKVEADFPLSATG